MNLTFDTIENRQQVWDNIQNVVDKPIAQTGKRMNWRWVNAAAAVITLLAIGLLIYTLTNLEYDAITYEAKAFSKTIVLEDNSEIVLSPNSSFTIDKDYGTVSRVVRLKGSAGFSVVHDASRPFITYIDKLIIRDLGTAFDVKTSSDGDLILIQVTEGKISVNDNSNTAKIVHAGEKVVYNKPRKELSFLQFYPHKGIQGEITIKGSNKPDTTHKKKPQSTVSSPDSSRKTYSNSTYPSSYPLDKLYTREEIEKLMHENIENAKKIIADMRQDGLVEKDIKDDQVSFKISNEGFIINGKAQSEKVYLKYKKKYFPHETTSRNWTWRHNFDESDAKN